MIKNLPDDNAELAATSKEKKREEKEKENE